MDREKVINAIECCIDGCLCAECDYEGIKRCWDKVLLTDVLDLLKDQDDMGKELTDAMELVRKKNERIEKLLKEQEAVVRCKDCKQSGIDSSSYPKYWCSAHTEYHDGDWFCADGVKKDD